MDVNLCAMLRLAFEQKANYNVNEPDQTILRIELMDKAQHNERPTDIVLNGTLREEAKRASLRRDSDKN